MTFRLSEVATALSTQEKSTRFAQRRVYRILDIDAQSGQQMLISAEYGG
jgi:hypothetical protein